MMILSRRSQKLNNFFTVEIKNNHFIFNIKEKKNNKSIT